jgi:DNA repair protein RadA/Sms
MGFCPQCRREGSLSEAATRASGPVPQTRPLRDIAVGDKPRRATGIAEVDRVLGGGLVNGSVVLVGGEPGVGKSTLLLQLAARVAGSGPVLLASAEESVSQVALRAERLGLDAPGLQVVADSRVDAIIAACAAEEPVLLIVDSIQTVTVSDADGTAGGVVQVRESAARFIEYAKQTGTVVALVGHVTKDGSLAGPKTLEHMVDVVMYLEGESDAGLRLLRSLKNRYGSINQVGVFTMGDAGMAEVPDPSGVLIEAHRSGASGTVLFPMVEGRRSMLCEVQALVVPTSLPQPRRSVKGLDAARVHQLLAVLARHAHVDTGKADVHVNVVGGVRLRDPAVDLAVGLAVVSSVLDRPLPLAAAWGEIGLTGEIRTASYGDRRYEEAARFDPELIIRPGEKGIRTIQEALLMAGLVASRKVTRIRGDTPQ